MTALANTLGGLLVLLFSFPAFSYQGSMTNVNTVLCGPQTCLRIVSKKADISFIKNIQSYTEATVTIENITSRKIEKKWKSEEVILNFDSQEAKIRTLDGKQEILISVNPLSIQTFDI